MAANSIFWKLPDKFSFFSRSLKKKVELQAYVVEFRRLLPLDALGFEEVSNAELLHAMVGLYDTCLPDITPEVLYSTVCGKWAKTLIFMRSLSDVINEQQHQYKKKNNISDNSSSDSDDAEEKTNNETLRFETGQATFLTEKHVHWEDEIDLTETTEVKVNNNIEDEEKSSVESDDSNDSADDEESSDSDSEEDSQKQKRTSQKQNKKPTSENLPALKDVHSLDSGVFVAQNVIAEETITQEEKKKKEKEKKEKEKEEEETGKFDGVFSDSEGEEESSDEEDDEEDFSVGVDDFIAAAKQRRIERDAGKITKETIGIESLIVGAATYERNYGSVKDKVIQLSLLAVRKKYQKCGIGKIILNTVKDPTFMGPYDSIAVYADHSAMDFFRKNNFSDDIILNSRFTELADHWINSTLMCYLPPFTGSDISGVHRSDYEIQAMDDEIEKWREKSLDAYQAQVSCMVRMQHEIKTLKALVDTQDEVIKTLTNSRERLQKEKFRIEKKLLDLQLEKEDEKVAIDVDDDETEDDKFYDSLVNLLNKQHVDDVKTDSLDMEAISKGDFGDVSKEDEELLSSLIHSQSEKQLIQQVRKSLLMTGQFNDVTVDCITKVECTQISFLETSLDGRHAMPGHAPVVKQLFYCGDYTNEDSLTNITSRGFTKKEFTQGMYGKGLYFTKHPSQASRFSPAGRLLLVNVNLGTTESVFQQDKKRTLPPAGFDSILTPGRPSSPVSPRFANQAEYVVFDPMQAVPIFLIEYSTTTI